MVSPTSERGRGCRGRLSRRAAAQARDCGSQPGRRSRVRLKGTAEANPRSRSRPSHSRGKRQGSTSGARGSGAWPVGAESFPGGRGP